MIGHHEVLNARFLEQIEQTRLELEKLLQLILRYEALQAIIAIHVTYSTALSLIIVVDATLLCSHELIAGTIAALHVFSI